MRNIAIFASGSGTNAENIINYFKGNSEVKIAEIFCNKRGAGVIERAEKLNVPVTIFDRKDFVESDTIINKLKDEKIDYIVLAGFLLLVPQNIIETYRGRIINIHPALLPKFGGKGMYGDAVHKAVIEARESVSGITIHHVTEQFDSGDNIFQATVEVLNNDTPESLATKIHKLEYRHFPEVIEKEIHRIWNK